jgi:hypothetical protein
VGQSKLCTRCKDLSVGQLAIRVLLAPAFVVAASMAVRRFGPQIGGLLGGLPLVAGPILLTFALHRGSLFTARAATTALLGLISLAVFVAVYTALAGRFRWIVCVPAGWLAYLAVTAALDALDVSALTAMLLACVSLLVLLWLLPEPPPAASSATRAATPSWELPIRALCALVLVLVLTAVAGSLGSRLSGLLTPFPVVASVLAAFTHAQSGPQRARWLLRGLLLGFFAFALFCFAIAVLVQPAGTVAAFTIATAAALAVQAGMLAAASARGGQLRES